MATTMIRVRDGGFVGAVAVAVVAVALMAAVVAMGVRRDPPPAYAVTPQEPRPAGGRLVGPELVTVDAAAPDRWRFFSFELGTVVDDPGAMGWDLAFRRFQVIVNGGEGFLGRAGVVDLGEAPFDEVERVPAAGYVGNTVRGDTVNAALGDWYEYSYLSHLLSPRPRSYAVRTADGRYAKLRFVGYYCPGALPGCVTFRYVYQGEGGVEMRGAGETGPMTAR